MRYLILFITVSLLTACSDKVEDLQPPPTIIINPPTAFIDTLQLLVKTNGIAGDNFSYAEIIAVSKIPGQANRQLVFTCDKGVFSNNSNSYTLTTGANDTTRAYLRYGKSDLVRVTAALATYSKELYVNFVNAYPGQVILDPEFVSLPHTLGAKSKVTVSLLRATGTVSEGQQVFYYDSVATAGPRRSVGGFFNSTISNSSGVSNSEFRLLDTTYTGLVFLKAYVETPGGRIFGQNVIRIE